MRTYFFFCILIYSISAVGQIELPDNFIDEPLPTGFIKPIGIVFDHLRDGYVWEKDGFVWKVTIHGIKSPEPLIVLRAVNYNGQIPQVKVVDVTGKILIKKVLRETKLLEETLNITALNAGVYLMSLTIGDKKEWRKFLVR